MSQYKYAEIADTVYFWFAANDTTGTAADGATPLYDVRLAGAAAGAAPTASGTPTLLTHANYTDGLHEIAIDTTGYAAGEYAVFCTLTVSTVNPAGFCGSFKLRTAGTAALATSSTNTGAIADAVFDEGIAAHTGAGSFGLWLDNAATANTSIQNKIGTPVALDSGTASLAGMLTKMADDNDGADFDATTDSLQKMTAMELTDVVEGSLTVQEVLRIVLAAVAGLSAGQNTTSPTFRDVADSKDRISATVDADGNRTAISLDGS